MAITENFEFVVGTDGRTWDTKSISDLETDILDLFRRFNVSFSPAFNYPGEFRVRGYSIPGVRGGLVFALLKTGFIRAQQGGGRAAHGVVTCLGFEGNTPFYRRLRQELVNLTEIYSEHRH